MKRRGKRDKGFPARLGEREKCVRSSAEGLRLLLHLLGRPEQGALNHLWKNWDQIMGEDLAALGRPCGHKDQTLHIGADDSMALQELALRAPEILERANAAVGGERFSEVRVSLLQGDAGLAREKTPAPLPAPAFEHPPIGGLLGKLSPDSPVARCYERFVALSQKP